MTEELKPCPFCGSEAERNVRNVSVHCANPACSANYVLFGPEEWNERPLEDALRSRSQTGGNALEWVPISEYKRYRERHQYVILVGYTELSKEGWIYKIWRRAPLTASHLEDSLDAFGYDFTPIAFMPMPEPPKEYDDVKVQALSK
ncbi:MAG: Lar family restriction alleviation protein [Desulfovibrio sp.]|jgi:hypothetical protein|nr:Lar family restriction alleviation protein [Desulfovibrio sp.]